LNQLKERIRSFVAEATHNKDDQLLDILWIFSYCLPSKTGYHENKKEFQEWLVRICIRNLDKKYGLNLIAVRYKMTVLDHFLNSTPGFLSKETFDEDCKLFRETLVGESSRILARNVKGPRHLPELDKKILFFVLDYVPSRIQDSMDRAEEFREHYPDKYYGLSDFLVRDDKEAGNISHFEIDPGKWTYIFNLLWNEALKEYKYQHKPREELGRGLPSKLRRLLPQYKEYSFWQLGDELVKMGIGYWTFFLSSKGKIDTTFIIPNFIYEGVKGHKTSLPRIENIGERIAEIKKGKAEKAGREKKPWSLEELVEESSEESTQPAESEIEASIASNPEVLEEGLELLGNQYPTPIGKIDMLYTDKNGNFVVVELKKGRGSHNVVGQIQKYMTWINEEFGESKQVRGIVVVKEHDKQLEYAAKGSRFPIEIKIFGRLPPIEENIKYCDRCRKPNKKSAKYCVKCGQHFWM